MPILWFMEYDIPQDEERKNAYLKFIFDDEYSCMVMDLCEKVGAKHDVWVDDSGHIVFTIEFKDAGDYERLTGDPEWLKGLKGLKGLVLNANIRTMRPAGE